MLQGKGFKVALVTDGRMSGASGKVPAAIHVSPEALAGGFADSKPLQVFAPRMVNGYQDAIGTLATLLKDIDTAVELARSLNCALPMAASAQQLLRLMSARGLAEADPSDLIQLFRDNPVVRQPTAVTIR